MTFTPIIWMLMCASMCASVLQTSGLPIHAHVPNSYVAHRHVANASRTQASKSLKAMLRHESSEATKGYVAADDVLSVRNRSVHHEHAALLHYRAKGGTPVAIPDDQKESFASEWRLRAQVKFPNLEDGNAPYYSLLGSPVSLVILGKGRSEYSGGKGMVAFFINTASGVGPYGRGFAGSCGGDALAGHGWIGQKNKVSSAKWYSVDAQKRRNGLTLTTGPGTTGDGTDATDPAHTANCDAEYTEAQFKMTEVSTINVGDAGVEMQDVELSTGGTQLYATGAMAPTDAPTAAPGADGDGNGASESGAWAGCHFTPWQLSIFVSTSLKLSQRTAFP